MAPPLQECGRSGRFAEVTRDGRGLGSVARIAGWFARVRDSSDEGGDRGENGEESEFRELGFFLKNKRSFSEWKGSFLVWYK